MTGGAGRARGSQRSIATIAAHRLAPLLLGAPVLLGIAVTLARLLTSSHPDIGYATTPNSDAEVLFLGHTIYQDPDDGLHGPALHAAVPGAREPVPPRPPLERLADRRSTWPPRSRSWGSWPRSPIRSGGRGRTDRLLWLAGGGGRGGGGLVARERAGAQPALRGPRGPRGLGVRPLRPGHAGPRRAARHGGRGAPPVGRLLGEAEHARGGRGVRRSGCSRGRAGRLGLAPGAVPSARPCWRSTWRSWGC